MSENIENTLNNYESSILDLEYERCFDCKEPNTYDDWCKRCNSERFQQEFNKWTSGNGQVDEFIQKYQLEARSELEVIEWIPNNRLRNIIFLANGGFGTVYKAIWLDGRIGPWDGEKRQWKRSVDPLKSEDYKEAKNNVE